MARAEGVGKNACRLHPFLYKNIKTEILENLRIF